MAEEVLEFDRDTNRIVVLDAWSDAKKDFARRVNVVFDVLGPGAELAPIIPEWARPMVRVPRAPDTVPVVTVAPSQAALFDLPVTVKKSKSRRSFVAPQGAVG